MLGPGGFVSRPILSWSLRRVLALWFLYLGCVEVGSTRHTVAIHPGLHGVCRTIIRKVQSYAESNLQSSLVGVRGGICTWLELNGCQQYKVVFTPVYKIAFRTVYVNGFVCCPGYARVGNACEPHKRTEVVPPGSQATTPSGTHPGTVPSVAWSESTGQQDPGTSGLSLTARPTTQHPSTRSTKETASPSPHNSPGAEPEVSPAGVKDKLLIILLVLVILVVMFVIATFTAHLAKLWQRGRMPCCAGILPTPRVRTGKRGSDESSKMACILGTISSDCSTDSVRSDFSQRSRSDRSGQSGSSEVTFIDDTDSGIVKHVVYDRYWKDTTSLLSYSLTTGTSRDRRSKVTGLWPRKCTPLLNIPPTPVNKKRRPSPPVPIRPDLRKSPTPVRQPSPGPYSYTSLNKHPHKDSRPNFNTQSPIGQESTVGPSWITVDETPIKTPTRPAYTNVKRTLIKPRPIYVTLEPDTDSVVLATECCEDDEDIWMTSHSPKSSSMSSVGYRSLSNQAIPHRNSGDGYDKLERNRQNFFPLTPETFPAPEYAVPCITTSTSCLATDTNSETQTTRASPHLRRSGTMPSMTLECLKKAVELHINKPKKEPRYIQSPRSNHKEMVFIDASRRPRETPVDIKHNSVG